MPRLFVSLPMAGKDSRTIEDEMHACLEKARELTGVEYELVDSICPVFPASPVYALGYAIVAMSFADAACFAPGWRDRPGCLVERHVADAYRIPILFDD